jgi:hypothetical protein
MGLFSKNTRVGVEEFCRHFYDDVIFHPIIAGQDFNEVWWDKVFQSIVEADKSFTVIDKSNFIREMTALRLELFGLAWLYKYKDERFTIPQSVFTMQYLEMNGKREIWDAMRDYGLVVAQSAVLDKSGKQLDGSTALGRSRITFVNTFRMEEFKKFASTNYKDRSSPTEEEKNRMDCITAVINRMLSEPKRAVLPLAEKLVERLGCGTSLNSRALFAIASVIYGLHQGAKEAIKDIKLE